MNDNLKTILITGASRGIGEAACKYFIKQKFKVIGISKSKSEISSENFLGLQCDISDEKSVLKLVSGISENTKITGLINGAGITNPSPELPTLEEFKLTFSVNLFAAYSIIRNFLPFMSHGSPTSIVNISSIGGVVGFPNNPAYGASKAALINLTKNLAIDLNKFGIRVNSISPGYIRTDMTQGSYINPEARKLREMHTILNRYGEPDEILGVLDFLISDKSSYVTGQNFVVDGGWTAKGLLI